MRIFVAHRPSEDRPWPAMEAVENTLRMICSNRGHEVANLPNPIEIDSSDALFVLSSSSKEAVDQLPAEYKAHLPESRAVKVRLFGGMPLPSDIELVLEPYDRTSRLQKIGFEACGTTGRLDKDGIDAIRLAVLSLEPPQETQRRNPLDRSSVASAPEFVGPAVGLLCQDLGITQGSVRKRMSYSRQPFSAILDGKRLLNIDEAVDLLDAVEWASLASNLGDAESQELRHRLHRLRRHVVGTRPDVASSEGPTTGGVPTSMDETLRSDRLQFLERLREDVGLRPQLERLIGLASSAIENDEFADDPVIADQLVADRNFLLGELQRNPSGLDSVIVGGISYRLIAILANTVVNSEEQELVRSLSVGSNDTLDDPEQAVRIAGRIASASHELDHDLGYNWVRRSLGWETALGSGASVVTVLSVFAGVSPITSVLVGAAVGLLMAMWKVNEEA